MSRWPRPNPPDLAWQARAACRADDVEADWFFPLQEEGRLLSMIPTEQYRRSWNALAGLPQLFIAV